MLIRICSFYTILSCSYGSGKFYVTDDKNGETIVYENDGQFGPFVQVKFTIENDGTLVFVEETGSFDNSWEGADDVPNYPQNVDQAWPGPKPTDPFQMNVNVKFDKHPEETSWVLSSLGTDGSWNVEETFDGATDGVHNDLLSIQFTNLQPTWYKLDIDDSAGDGICCVGRRGWVAVTGYLLATRRSGLVWGSNGEYGSGIEIYLKMNSDGMVNQMSFEAPARL